MVMNKRCRYRDFGRYDGPVDALDVINECVTVTDEMYADCTRHFPGLEQFANNLPKSR